MYDHIRITKIFISHFGDIEEVDLDIDSDVILMPRESKIVHDIMLVLSMVLTQEMSDEFQSKLQKYTYIGISFECGKDKYHYKFIHDIDIGEEDQERHILHEDEIATEQSFADAKMRELFTPRQLTPFGISLNMDRDTLLTLPECADNLMRNILCAENISNIDDYMLLYPEDKEAVVSMLERKYGTDRADCVVENMMCYIDGIRVCDNLPKDKEPTLRERLARSILAYGVLMSAERLWTFFDDVNLRVPPLIAHNLFEKTFSSRELLHLVANYMIGTDRQLFIYDDTDNVLTLWHELDSVYMFDSDGNITLMRSDFD